MVIGIVVATVTVIVISGSIKGSRASGIENDRTKDANEAEQRKVLKEAETKTSHVKSYLRSSLTLAAEVPECLHTASGWLQTAEREYRANAFAPFWDAVEQAAIWLGDYNYKVKEISGKAHYYYKELDGCAHTFPVFPVSIQSLPDATFVISELRRITRLGQTNFHFANIWEHRSTRREIVAGFTTLNNAISNLGSAIEDSVSNLRDSISSDLARVVEEQIKTRDAFDSSRQELDKSIDAIDTRLLEQNRMLDNIQHKRTPKVKDIPSKR